MRFAVKLAIRPRLVVDYLQYSLVCIGQFEAMRCIQT
jgi:hypothetical protein